MAGFVYLDMKAMIPSFPISRLGILIGLLLVLGNSVSCTTTYDSYGRPVRSVEPGVAIAGAAAALVVGAAIANDGDRRHHGRYRQDRRYRDYRRHRDYRGSYYCR